ncbi:hypothetical protein ACWC98_26865 [Streptomyces goshikiensis]
MSGLDLKLVPRPRRPADPGAVLEQVEAIEAGMIKEQRRVDAVKKGAQGGLLQIGSSRSVRFSEGSSR